MKTLKTFPLLFLLSLCFLGCTPDKTEKQPFINDVETSNENRKEYIQKPEKQVTCNESSARLLGRLYYLANPINEQTNPEALSNFVQQNSDYLHQNSAVIACTKILGQRLIQQGINSFSQADQDRAYESVLSMPGGTMERARDVASSINQGAVDAYMMGEELMWLAQVIPSATDGDWYQFNNSGTQTRQSIRQVWPFYQSMMELDPSMAAIMNSVMAQVEPIVEEQVMMLALMMGE